MGRDQKTKKTHINLRDLASRKGSKGRKLGAQRSDIAAGISRTRLRSHRPQVLRDASSEIGRGPKTVIVARRTAGRKALRRNPKIVLACKAANISRNTLYTHLRKDARFRRQWERALDRGWERRQLDALKELESDPRFQHAIQRAAESRQWLSERQNGITNQL